MSRELLGVASAKLTPLGECYTSSHGTDNMVSIIFYNCLFHSFNSHGYIVICLCNYF